jgi:hypothetical protein
MAVKAQKNIGERGARDDMGKPLTGLALAASSGKRSKGQEH